MTTKLEPEKSRLSPTARIVLSTLAIGYISALGGCFGGALLFPDSNTASLLFIPLGGGGIAAGMCLGIAWSAFKKDGHALGTELWWIGVLWVLTLFTTYKLNCDILPVCLQGLPILLGTIMMASKRLQPNMPPGIRNTWIVYLIAALLFLSSSLFPPVTFNKWMPVERRPVYTASDPMPEFVFCTDSRLDASQSYAELGIDSNRLLYEWLAITVGAGLILAALAFRGQRLICNATEDSQLEERP